MFLFKFIMTNYKNDKFFLAAGYIRQRIIIANSSFYCSKTDLVLNCFKKNY